MAINIFNAIEYYLYPLADGALEGSGPDVISMFISYINIYINCIKQNRLYLIAKFS
jgi:hypothetical protein